MSTFCFNSFLTDIMAGNVVPNTQNYAVMLVNNYVPDIQNHKKRSDVTNEVVGTGYAAGGQAVTLTQAFNSTTLQQTMTFSSPSWAASAIAATGAVIYVARGGAPSADNLVAYIDFGGTVVSTGGTFQVAFSNPLTFQK